VTDSLWGYKPEQLARAEQWLPAVLARVPEVTSADKAYAWMRANDLYVPRSYVREKWGEIIRGQEYLSIVNRLSENDMVPRRWMEESVFEFGSQYNYVMKITGVDIASGELREEFMTVASNDNLTVEEIQGQAVNAASRYGFATIDPSFDVGFDTIKWRRPIL